MVLEWIEDGVTSELWQAGGSRGHTRAPLSFDTVKLGFGSCDLIDGTLVSSPVESHRDAKNIGTCIISSRKNET